MPHDIDLCIERGFAAEESVSALTTDTAVLNSQGPNYVRLGPAENTRSGRSQPAATGDSPIASVLAASGAGFWPA